MNATSLPRPKPSLVLAAVLAAALLLAAALAATATAKPKPYEPTKGPAGLAFYDPPKTLPKGHGKLIWSRASQAPVAGAASTRLVLYTSTTATGKRTSVSGYVAVPKGKAPKGGWPVITWAHGTTGLADICAPSRFNSTGETQFEAWLDAGYAVAATDYQGLGTPGLHQYLVGRSEGRSVVDIVRAARQLDSRISPRMLIAGVSQGGQSALFAASVAKAWTPELKLRGTAAYAPGTHFLEQKGLLSVLTSPSSLSAVAVSILAGATTQSLTVTPESILTDQALALYPEVNQVCLPALSASNSYGGIPPSNLIRSDADTTELDKILAAMNPAVKTSAPILLLQGTADGTAFPFYTDQLNTELGAAGDKVTYIKYPGVDHGGIVAAGEGDALAFFERRLPAP